MTELCDWTNWKCSLNWLTEFTKLAYWNDWITMFWKFGTKTGAGQGGWRLHRYIMLMGEYSREERLEDFRTCLVLYWNWQWQLGHTLCNSFLSRKLRHRPDTEVLPHIYVDFEVRIIFQGIPYAPLPAAAEAAGITKKYMLVKWLVALRMLLN